MNQTQQQSGLHQFWTSNTAHLERIRCDSIGAHALVPVRKPEWAQQLYLWQQMATQPQALCVCVCAE